MKIACVMTTEHRAKIWGIGLTSFLTQQHEDRELIVVLPGDDLEAYLGTAQRYVNHPDRKKVIFVPTARLGVLERFDTGIHHGLMGGARVIAKWDDDDFAPVDRLTQTATVAKMWDDRLPCYCSYTAGWFANLRTFRAEFIETLPAHLWGGTLAFNRQAWHRAGGFVGKPVPGQDRVFQQILKNAPESRQHRLVGDATNHSFGYPIAWSHGKNVATWLKTHGCDLSDKLETWLPKIVHDEVLRCQQLMIDTRTFPPQPE